jgi:hypothetical protein
LVAEVQISPPDALRREWTKLSPTQRSNLSASTGEEEGSDTANAPDRLTDQSPLVLPVIVEGALYRATVGHITIGWRIFPDWRVTFENISGEATSASLAIGMGPGPLLGAVIQ